MRINVNVSDEMNGKIDNYAKQFGVSKSQLCSMLIGQAIMSYDKANDMMGEIKESVKKAVNDTINENK